MEIIKYPDKRLRAANSELESVTAAVKSRVERMLELMYQAPGIGLAAPQVGWNVRLFVLNVTGEPEDEFVFINPTIKPTGEDVPHNEGCLSFPGVTGDVIRPIGVQVSALGLAGQEFELETDGLLARCIQHEFDHLRGVLFIDHLTSAGLAKVAEPLKELRRDGKTKQKDVTPSSWKATTRDGR